VHIRIGIERNAEGTTRMENNVGVSIIDKISPEKGIHNYPSNRPPLMGNPVQKLPLGSVKPGGWIKTQLELMRDGMAGHLHELSSYLKPDNGWLNNENTGWEEQPYWFRGFHDLGILLGDDRINAEAEKWIEAIFASQDKDGYFGPAELKTCRLESGKTIPDLWPNMVMIDTLRSHYEYTGDGRVIELLRKVFSWCAAMDDSCLIPPFAAFVPPGSESNECPVNWHPVIQVIRSAEMLPHLYWLYNRTGEEWLLGLATKFKQRMEPPEGEWVSRHCVNFTQKYRVAAVYYQQSGDPNDLAETENCYQKHMDAWGQQPGGIFAADEQIRDGKTDPRQGFETCAMVEFAKSFEMLSEITGDAVYADRCEDILFNSFPAAQTPDLKGLHYITAGNQPQLDAGMDHDYFDQSRLLDYSPYDIYRCCQHNATMGWPYYAEHLWMVADGDGLVAWMYGESEVSALVADCVKVTITEETGYPFDTAVSLKVSPEKPVRFPLYLRVPAWAVSFVLKLNGEEQCSGSAAGQFALLDRTWLEGDLVELQFTEEINVKRWGNGADYVSVYRGPLSYSLKIEENWVRHGGTYDWPEWEVYPKSPWNYGLLLDKDHPEESICVKSVQAVVGQPWEQLHAPIELAAKGCRVPTWKLGGDKTVGEVPKSPFQCEEPPEELTLVPMGCARLRISCFPVIEDGKAVKSAE
jgi:hypothetical protein